MVLFTACAPDQYAQKGEYDDVYFNASDRTPVAVTKLNDPQKAAYDREGSYVYQEEVASRNFNPDAVDVNRYTSDNNAEETQAEYYVSEEERALDNNQFNGARPSYASFNNPAFARARMWNDPFFNPMWGGMGMGGFGNPYWNSMAFYDPFFDPFMMGPMGFDPFWGPGAGFGFRPGFNVSVGFGFGFGNAFAFGSPWGWNRWNRWGRFGGGFGGYRAGFYDGLFFGNPYNRFGFCPTPVVVVNNGELVANRRSVVRGQSTNRGSRLDRSANISRDRNATSTRSRLATSRSRNPLSDTRSRNAITNSRSRSSYTASARQRASYSSPTR
ncbi:MAG: hypothetical protein AAF223_24035, partial [Bacteroidota bacterium]